MEIENLKFSLYSGDFGVWGWGFEVSGWNPGVWGWGFRGLEVGFRGLGMEFGIVTRFGDGIWNSREVWG